ncbi:membrane protein [Glaciibacter superstes]|uniref:membrane protein n=1 Tax=Glaciibacter superstes TaxID=501023 RepID=UPI0003B5075F|nr:membrane protein [Glaciibacter superstes]
MIAPGENLAEPSIVAEARPRGRARVMLYVVLLVGVLALNGLVFAWGAAAGWWQPHAHSLQIIAAISQLNILFAILPRQHWMVNLLSALATRAPTSWPLRLRWRLAQYYHVGGLHVGGALSGTAWYVVYVALLAPAWADGEPGYDDVSVAMALLIVIVLLAICAMAAPRFRTRHHDAFEASHRFGTWAVLVFSWINALLLAQLQTPARTFGEALLNSPIFWMLVVSTLLAVWPWLLLRRVAITVERPSDHAAVVRLDHGYVPPVGTTRAISRHPLFGWHPFACVPASSGESGYRMVVSRAGGWTSTFIDHPPTHVWIRGIPTAGVANAKRLFSRVLYVVTGSGIGPVLGHLLTDTQGARLVWVTKTPRETYGDGLVDEVTAAQPEAVIWNTSEQGKPDVFGLAYDAYVASGADAVICVANKSVTDRVVGEFERRSVPAFGPIWDS